MQIKVDDQNKELKAHGSEEYPTFMSVELLSRYDKGFFLDHWHSEVEFTYIIKGEILYTVNGREYLLKKGEGIFCNQNMMHSGRMHHGRDCLYLTITFLPKLIYGFETSLIKTKYIDELVRNPTFSHLLLNCSDEHANDILYYMEKIYLLYLCNKEIEELKLITLLTSIWQKLYECYKSSSDNQPLSHYNEKDLIRLKKILSFIHENYQKKITLHEISKVINICENECCRFFKKQTKSTITAYITAYRIEKSLYLLDNSDLTITELAYTIGFSSLSSYTQAFRRKMGVTPTQYRKSDRRLTIN